MTENDLKLIKVVMNDEFMAALQYYISQREEKLKDSLVMATGNDTIKYQAAILELRNMKKMKEEVLARRDK